MLLVLLRAFIAEDFTEFGSNWEVYAVVGAEVNVAFFNAIGCPSYIL